MGAALKEGENLWTLERLQLNRPPLVGRVTLKRAACRADAFPAPLDLPVQVFVGAVRVVVEKTEAFDARFNGQVHSLAEGRVAPAAGERVFLVRVLGVMKQQVRAPAILHVLLPGQPSLVPISQFIVREEHETLALLHEFVPIAAVGVIERHLADPQPMTEAIPVSFVRPIAPKLESSP